MERRLFFNWLLALALTGALTGSGAAQELPPPTPLPPEAASQPAFGLQDLIRIGLEQNPNLMQADLEVEAARGRAVQAGLYPNPTVNLVGDELGSGNRPGGC